MIHRPIGILVSEHSRQWALQHAQDRGQMYRFQGSQQTLEWPAGPWGYLSPNGCASLLRRVGIAFDWLSEEFLQERTIDGYELIFVPGAGHLQHATIDALSAWSQPGRWLVISSPTNLPDRMLGVQHRERMMPESWVALQGPAAGRWQPLDPWIVQGPGFIMDLIEPAAHAMTWGTLQLHTPEADAPSKPLSSHAVVSTDRSVFLTWSVFEWAGALLQAQADIEPWRGRWRLDANGYLDRLAFRLQDRLDSLRVATDARAVRIHPWGRHRHAVVFRHDTDDSSDSAYLEIERRERIPATYAVLQDHRMGDWRRLLGSDTACEWALHYRTEQEGWLEWLRRRWLKPFYRLDRRAVSGMGLAHQVEQAQRDSPRPIRTLHRHASFILYPEIIDALDAASASAPGLLGGSTFFRASVVPFQERWARRWTVPEPHTLVSLWFPYHLMLSARQDHRLLDGWELTTLIEPDSRLQDWLWPHVRQFPGGAYMLTFHPAHARSDKYRRGGNLAWFDEALWRARAEKCWITTAAAMFERLNRLEHIHVGRSGDGWNVAYRGDEPLEEVAISLPGRSEPIWIDVLQPGQQLSVTR